jgi:hypothetical protein
MNMQNKPTLACGNCAFFRVAPGAVSGEGICVRFPPTMFMLTQDNPLNPRQKTMAPGGGFPPTRKDQWCGEHKMKN